MSCEARAADPSLLRHAKNRLVAREAVHARVEVLAQPSAYDSLPLWRRELVFIAGKAVDAGLIVALLRRGFCCSSLVRCELRSIAREPREASLQVEIVLLRRD